MSRPVSPGGYRDRKYRAAIEYELSVWQNNRIVLDYFPDGAQSQPAYIDTRQVLARRMAAVFATSTWDQYTLLQGWPNLAQSVLPAIPRFGRDVVLQRQAQVALRSEGEVWQNLQNTLIFQEPVVEAPFVQTDWPVPLGYAVARRITQSQIASRAETEVLQDTPLVLLTTPAPPVLSTLPDYLAAAYVQNAKRYVALRAPPEVIGSFPTIILTTPGFNLTPGVVVAPEFFVGRYPRRVQPNNGLGGVIIGEEILANSSLPAIPQFGRDIAIQRQSRVAVKSEAEVWQNNQNTLYAVEDIPIGKATFPDRLPRAPYRQYQVEGDPQSWLTTPPPPDGRQEFPADVRDRLRGARHIALRAEPEVWQNLQNTLYSTDLPYGQRSLPDDVRDRTRARRYAAAFALTQGDPQTWLTTAAPPDGKRTLPDYLRALPRQQPDVVQVSQDLLATVVAAGIPEGQQSFPATVRGRAFTTAITSQPQGGPSPVRAFIVAFTLRVQLDSNPSDTAGVDS